MCCSLMSYGSIENVCLFITFGSFLVSQVRRLVCRRGQCYCRNEYLATKLHSLWLKLLLLQGHGRFIKLRFNTVLILKFNKKWTSIMPWNLRTWCHLNGMTATRNENFNIFQNNRTCFVLDLSYLHWHLLWFYINIIILSLTEQKFEQSLPIRDQAWTEKCFTADGFAEFQWAMLFGLFS